MATPEHNRTLSTDAANALLTSIKISAGLHSDPGALKALAEAYAAVDAAMPRPVARPRVG